MSIYELLTGKPPKRRWQTIYAAALVIVPLAFLATAAVGMMFMGLLGLLRIAE